MTRYLINESERTLTQKNVNLAKEILRRKCLVGLLIQKGESFRRAVSRLALDLDCSRIHTKSATKRKFNGLGLRKTVMRQ